MATVEQEVFPEVRLLLRGVPWETYAALRDLECNNHIFMTYDRGTLELTSPSGQHDNIKKLIGQLVEAFATELNIPRRSFGNCLAEHSVKPGGGVPALGRATTTGRAPSPLDREKNHGET